MKQNSQIKAVSKASLAKESFSISVVDHNNFLSRSILSRAHCNQTQNYIYFNYVAMASEIKLPAVEEINQNRVSTTEKVVVCRGRSCRKYQAEQVWQNFKQKLPPQVELMSVPCLGQCGNGAMVVIDADNMLFNNNV
ncbi:MAG: (2Fe-2S) ferredoxin domain-containing protein, partial [Cyanobacteria bacterium J06649_11]